MRRWVAIAGLILCVGSRTDALAQDARKLTELRLKERAGYFLVFLPPRYPFGAQRRGEAATIDVFGTVESDGTFRIERFESEKPAPDFEEAIRSAATRWSMRPAYDAQCEPISAPVQAKLWFEVRNGDPVVAFAQPIDKEGEFDPPLKFTRRPEIAYPREERNLDFTVEAIVRVLPGGIPEKVRVVEGALGRRFAGEVEEALLRARFDPEGLETPVCALFTVVFRKAR